MKQISVSRGVSGSGVVVVVGVDVVVVVGVDVVVVGVDVVVVVGVDVVVVVVGVEVSFLAILVHYHLTPSFESSQT
jgi:hypothetical protein